MIPGALFVCLLVGFSVGSPLRRQDGDGKFGYEYDVKHPGGNSRVHVRAGGARHSNSNPSEYISDASYVNPHYVEPHYQPNRYGHYPTSYDRSPPHGYIGQRVPVYEERSRYPKLAGYQQVPHSGHKAYGIHPHAQEISQSSVDVEPFYQKPAIVSDPVYSSPQFTQQAAIEHSDFSHPPSKIEQIPLHPETTYDNVPFQKVEQIPSEPIVVEQISDLHEPQLPIEKDTLVVVPNPPVDQQVLVDDPEEVPVILQKPLDDYPELSQVSEDIPPPKVIIVEPEPPIVQQSSVDVPPPISDVQYIDDDDVVVQLPLDPKPSIKTVVEPPVVQQVADDDADITLVKPLPYSDDILHRSGDPIIQTPLDKYPSQTSYDSGDFHDPNPAPLYAAAPKYEFVPFGPPYEKISHSTEIIHGPPRSPYSVKLPPPPPSTKSIAPPLLHQQEHVDVPLASSSFKLPPPPPPPLTKSVGPYVPENNPPLYQSVKLPPPPPPVTKSLNQEYVDIPLTKNPHSVKLPPPPPPVTKSIGPVVPAVLPHAQEYIEVPLTKNPPVLQSVKLPPPPPGIKSIVPIVSPPVQEPVDVILTKNPPPSYSVKLPPPSGPFYKSPPQYRPVTGIKAPPYVRPVASYPPVSHSVKQPYARSYYVKSPHVSKPPLSYVPLTKSPVPYSVKRPYAYPPVSPYRNVHYGNPHVKSPYVKTPITKTSPISYGVKHPVVSNVHSVKHPKAVGSVKGYPNVKVPSHLAQSSYADEPLPESVPISPSIKHPYNTAPVLPQYDSPISHGVKHPVVSNVHSVKHPKAVGAVKGYPNVKGPVHLAQSSHGDEPLLESGPYSPSIKHPHNTAPVLSQYDSPVGNPHQQYSPQPGGPVKKYLPVGHPVETSFSEPKEESDLSIPPEIPYPSEEASPLQKYPPVSHAFQISPVIPHPEPKSESSLTVLDDKLLNADVAGPSPLDKYPPVSHSIRLPVSIPTPTPNLFAAVPSSNDEYGDEDKVSIESPLSDKNPVSHALILPSSISEPKVSALRSDALSSPISHPVRVGARRNRGRYEEPQQDFPAFPVESAYKYPDPVSDQVAHLSNSYRPRGGHAHSHYEPDESESSNSPSVEEAKLEIDRVNKAIGLSFGDRLHANSRLS